MSIGILTIAIILLVIMIIGIGTPIAFGLGFLGLIGIVSFLDMNVLYQIAEISVTTGTNLFMITLPLFILMAEVVSVSGVGDDMYTAAHRWLSWLPGGLSIASIATCTGFGAICGSSPATAATIGVISIPEMIKRGYSKHLAVGAVAAGGTLGILIPPSITMVIYGVITQTSIGKLFMAGIIPGIVVASIMSAAIVIAVIMKPALAPPVVGVTWRQRFSSLKRVWAFVVLVLSIIGTIYTGIATPTESAAIGATVAIFIALSYGRLTLRTLHAALLSSVAVTAMIMFMVIGGGTMAFLLSTLGIPQYVTGLITSLEVSRWSVMIIINIVLIVMGCLLDPMAILIISLPILFPIVTELGFDPIWFGIVITINVEIGMITPPFGLNLFILNGAVKGITMKDIIVGSLPFVFLLMVGLGVIMAFPDLSTWLPAKMGF
ncbi:MAG: TRAP transporter large permease [Deltaproteobacteria bacterium]|nr:TRAP transporter large permease [Deltaproteobacteria bacterium]